jgi:hypothetical protein
MTAELFKNSRVIWFLCLEFFKNFLRILSTKLFKNTLPHKLVDRILWHPLRIPELSDFSGRNSSRIPEEFLHLILSTKVFKNTLTHKLVHRILWPPLRIPKLCDFSS